MLRKVALKGHPPLHIQQPLSDPQGSNQYTQPPGLRPRWALRVPAHRLATRQHRQPNLRAKPTPTPTPGGVMLPASPCGARCPKETPVGGRPGASPCRARFPLQRLSRDVARPHSRGSPQQIPTTGTVGAGQPRHGATRPCVTPWRLCLWKPFHHSTSTPPRPSLLGREKTAQSAYPCLSKRQGDGVGCGQGSAKLHQDAQPYGVQNRIASLHAACGINSQSTDPLVF